MSDLTAGTDRQVFQCERAYSVVQQIAENLELAQPDLAKAPPLDFLYDENRQNYLSLLAYPKVCQSLHYAAELSGRSLVDAYTNLAGWLPRAEGRVLVERALSELGNIQDEAERVASANSSLRRVDGILQRSEMCSAVELITAGLASERERTALLTGTAWFTRPNIAQVVLAIRLIEDEEKRLSSLEDMTFDVPAASASEFVPLLQSFRDPNIKARAMVCLLRMLPGHVSPHVIANPQLLMEILEGADDPEARSDAMVWLALGIPEYEARLRRGHLSFAGSLGQPEVQATALLACVGLGTSDLDNKEAVLAALSSIQRIEDEALRVAMLGQYVSCIPGTPPWGEVAALHIALQITDERLRAKGLSSLVLLPRIRTEVLENGMQLEDPWARATVMFSSPSWSLPPAGTTKAAWRKKCLDAARGVPIPSWRARYLAKSAVRTRGKHRQRVAEEAAEAARLVKSPSARARALDQLIRSELLEREAVIEALEAAWSIPPSPGKYKALARLAQLLDAAAFVDLVGRILTSMWVDARDGASPQIVSSLDEMMIDLSWPVKYLDLESGVAR